jgi:hypothetical protein
MPPPASIAWAAVPELAVFLVRLHASAVSTSPTPGMPPPKPAALDEPASAVT